jgi:hypothetical protein
MYTARAGHTATLLPNGKVLVAGGANAGVVVNYLSSAEIYDPATGRWTSINSMSVARTSYTATLLRNGQVLVAGGLQSAGNVTPSAELFNPSTGQWTAANDMTVARENHTATMLPNGQVLVVAGLGAPSTGVLSSAELYDPVTGVWTQTSTSMNTARYSHTATALPNGQVLVAGGYNFKTLTLSSSEIYDPGLPVAGAIILNNPVMLPGGAFQFDFTNTPGAIFSVSATANISLPLSDWTTLNTVTETSPGQFQFTDSSASNGGQRFYCVHSP